jgi:hypothetical protein
MLAAIPITIVLFVAAFAVFEMSGLFKPRKPPGEPLWLPKDKEPGRPWKP